MEWLDEWYDEDRGLRRIAGGAWGIAEPEKFKLWGNAAPPQLTSGSFGFRLLAEPEK